jgi:hypothetical protein
MCHVSRVASGTSADAAIGLTVTLHPAAYVVSSALALCEASVPNADATAVQLRLRLARGVSNVELPGPQAAAAAAVVSEEAARLTLRAPPQVVTVTPAFGTAEGGTAVAVRWVNLDGGEGDGDEMERGGSAACRFGSLGPIRGRILTGGAGVECVTPAGNNLAQAADEYSATVAVSARAGTSGWSDPSPTSASDGIGAVALPMNVANAAVFTYASVWSPLEAVPRFVTAGDGSSSSSVAVDSRTGSGVGGEGAEVAGAGGEGGGASGGVTATMMVLGRGFPPRLDPSAACAGLPRALLLSAGHGYATCSVSVDAASAAAAAAGPPFAVSFVFVLVGRCRLTVSKLVLKVPIVSALEASER